MVERLIWDQEAASSSLATWTNYIFRRIITKGKCEFIADRVNIKGSLFCLSPKDKGRIFEYETQQTTNFKPGVIYYIVTDSESYPFSITAHFLPHEFSRGFKIIQ